MLNLKKLLVTVMMTGMLSTSFCSVAFAESTEDESTGQILGTEVPMDSTDIANTDSISDTDSDESLQLDDNGDDADDFDYENPEDTSVEDTDASEDEQYDDNGGKEASYSESDLRYLSCLIYAEAGNQSYSAMLGVANVVLNRVKSDIYWHVKTIKDVIYDDKWSVQFAVTIKNNKGISPIDKALKAYDTGKYNSGNPDAEKLAMNKAIKAAKSALNGKNNIGSYLCFSNKNYKSYVKRHYSKYKIIDDTIFFRTE